MKQKIVILFLVFASIANTSNAGWVIGENPDQPQITKLENQIVQEQHTNDGMGIVILVLAVGVVGALVAGTIIGSRTRRAAKHHVLPEQ